MPNKNSKPPREATPPWLEALVQELKVGDKVPPGWVTLEQVMTALDMGRSRAFYMLEEKVAKGELAKRKFKVLSPRGRRCPHIHYGPPSGKANGSSSGRPSRKGLVGYPSVKDFHPTVKRPLPV